MIPRVLGRVQILCGCRVANVFFLWLAEETSLRDRPSEKCIPYDLHVHTKEYTLETFSSYHLNIHCFTSLKHWKEFHGTSGRLGMLGN